MLSAAIPKYGESFGIDTDLVLGSKIRAIFLNVGLMEFSRLLRKFVRTRVLSPSFILLNMASVV